MASEEEEFDPGEREAVRRDYGRATGFGRDTFGEGRAERKFSRSVPEDLTLGETLRGLHRSIEHLDTTIQDMRESNDMRARLIRLELEHMTFKIDSKSSQASIDELRAEFRALPRRARGHIGVLAG